MEKVDKAAPKTEEPVALPDRTEKIKFQVLAKIGMWLRGGGCAGSDPFFVWLRGVRPVFRVFRQSTLW
jgi:hypothetical protein